MHNDNQSAATTLGIVAALVLALGSLAAPLQAETITGSFDGNSTLTPTGVAGIFTQNFSGDGVDTHFGAFTATSQSTVDFSNPPDIVITDGMLLETFAKGTLFGTGSGSGKGNGQGSATFTIDFLVTGGTGALAGNTGEVIVTGTITQTSPTTESVQARYTGSVATPEPSTLALLAAGFAGLGWRMRKR